MNNLSRDLIYIEYGELYIYSNKSSHSFEVEKFPRDTNIEKTTLEIKNVSSTQQIFGITD